MYGRIRFGVVVPNLIRATKNRRVIASRICANQIQGFRLPGAEKPKRRGRAALRESLDRGMVVDAIDMNDGTQSS